MDWLKHLKGLQVPMVITVGGLACVFLSFFSGLPADGNGWYPVPRPEVNLGLLIVALFLVSSGIAMTILSKTYFGDAARSGKMKKDSYSGDPERHPMVLKWWKLSTTQKEIVIFIYEHSHRDVIPFDQLYRAFCKKYGSKDVPNSDEMYFRLRTLEFEGFLRLRAVAERATDVEKITDVRTALSKGDIIATR